ncbi:MAG: aldehyde dehydrogenase family protein, partial [Microthrixaceae bacterium]|nr:aldehyde dehydrogenase family protein [Microthrixaceae bacterium]
MSGESESESESESTGESTSTITAAAQRERALLEAVPTRLFIGGSWVDATSAATFDVTDPSTGAVIRAVADADDADGIRALDAAVAAQASWAATPPRTRSDILRRAFDLVRERGEDLALLMTLEMGKPLAQSRGEVAYGAEFLRWFSEEAVRIGGRYGQNPEGSGRMIVSQRPVGPVL